MHPTRISAACFMVLMLAGWNTVLAQSTSHQMHMQHSPQAAAEQVATYSCPMHPDVVSDTPGSCPKCGMTLVKKETGQTGKEKSSAAANLKEVRKLLIAAKSQLAREGKFDCCIEDGCNQCALDEQECSCHNDLKKGETVCNECWIGWQRGEGKDKSVDPKSVKTSFKGDDHD